MLVPVLSLCILCFYTYILHFYLYEPFMMLLLPIVILSSTLILLQLKLLPSMLLILHNSFSIPIWISIRSSSIWIVWDSSIWCSSFVLSPVWWSSSIWHSFVWCLSSVSSSYTQGNAPNNNSDVALTRSAYFGS